MTSTPGWPGLLRNDPGAFAALRDRASERLAVDPGAIEKGLLGRGAQGDRALGSRSALILLNR